MEFLLNVAHRKELAKTSFDIRYDKPFPIYYHTHWKFKVEKFHPALRAANSHQENAIPAGYQYEERLNTSRLSTGFNEKPMRIYELDEQLLKKKTMGTR